MRIFLATSGLKAEREILLASSARSILMSYKRWSSIDFMPAGSHIMVDSGAFSAWQNGLSIKLDNYIEFLKRTMAEYSSKYNLVPVNLDVIPGECGRYPTKAETEYAAQQGWENYQAMSEHIAGVLPVFHQHEPFVWLEKMLDIGYIGISPDNGLSNRQKMGWLDDVFSFLGYHGIFSKSQLNSPQVKTHAFGFTYYRGLFTYPFYSADSTTWIRQRMDIGHILKMEHELTEMWRTRGVYWGE